MHPVLLITIVILSVLYSLAWHDQPARKERPINESSSKAPKDPILRRQLKSEL